MDNFLAGTRDCRFPPQPQQPQAVAPLRQDSNRWAVRDLPRSNGWVCGMAKQIQSLQRELDVLQAVVRWMLLHQLLLPFCDTLEYSISLYPFRFIVL